MPVSLCEWRVRIGTFVHWIRDYEIRERKERWLKERTRILKVLFERLKEKKSDSELEKEEVDENAAENRQEGSNPIKSRQCPHRTNINSSGSFDTKDLLTSCDHCIHDLLTPSHFCSKDLLTPADGCIKEFLKPSDSTVKDLITPNDRTVKDLINQKDCSVKDLINQKDCSVKDLTTPDDCRVKDLVTPDYCSVKDLITPDHCSVKDLITPGDCRVKDLVTPDYCSVKDLITPGDCSLKASLTAEECSVKDLIAPPDCSVKNFNTSSDFSVKDLITPDDCNINVKDLISPDDCSIKAHLKVEGYSVKDLIIPHDCSGKDLITPDDCNVKDLITRDDCSVEDLNTSNDCSFKDPITTPEVSSVKDLITPDDFSASTPVGGKSSVIAEDISRPFCNDERRGKTKEHGRSTSLCHGPSLTSKTALIPEQTPPISELLKSGDVELNPGPREWPDLELERELMSLVAEISPQYYTILCNSLGVGQAGSEAILTKNILNVPKSLFEIICSWGLKQRDGTNYKEVLADKLRSVHLDALGTKLLEGRYLPPENSPPASTSDEGKHTSQLTQEQVNRCAQDLKKFYRTYMCKIKTDPLDFNTIFEFEKIYTNLVLLRNEAGKQFRTPLEYENLLRTKVNNELSKRLMVEGEGGAGKTTFCSKIAWDWCNGSQEFQQFQWVLLIPMRDIQDGQTVGDIVKGYLSDSNSVRPEEIDKYILAEPSKVFIIFDGLDEYRGDITTNGSDIAKILRSEKFKECTVLVTTRPWKADQIKSNQNICKPYSFIEVEGFSSDNISSYIMKYFANDENAGVELFKFIEDNDVIKENMAPFPIYVAMLCTLWRDSTSERRDMICKLKTFSQLFKQMIMFLKDHFVSKIYMILEENVLKTELKKLDNFLLKIGAIAFTGLLEKQLSFNEDAFSSCHEAMDACCRIGVLSRENRLVSRWKRSAQPVTSSVFFPHKLFQEYVSALYLASLYDLDKEEYSNSMRKILQDDPREFRYLLYFTSSQANDVALDIISQLKEKRMHTFGDDFLVDVTFEAHDATVGKMVGKDILTEGKTLTIDKDMSAHTFSGYLFIMEKCTMDTLILRDRSCGPTVSRDLADILSSPSSLTTLNLVRTSFHDDFYLLLKHVSTLKREKSINSVQELHIDHVFINDLQKFDISIETLFPSLQNLLLDTLQTVSPGIIKHLAHSSLSMLKIELPNYQKYGHLEVDLVPLIGEPDSLGQIFSGSFPHLTNLTFESVVIGNIRCEAILRSLRNHVHIQTIRVIKCFTDDELDSLASELSTEKSIEITIQHDPEQKHLALTRKGPLTRSVLSPELMDALCHRTCVCELHIDNNILDRISSEELILDLNDRKVDSKIHTIHFTRLQLQENQSLSCLLGRFISLLPCLTDLKIDGCSFHDGFYKEIIDRASFSKIHRIHVRRLQLQENQSLSCLLGRFVSLLPCLTDLKIDGCSSHDEFYKEIIDRASFSKIQTMVMTSEWFLPLQVSEPASKQLAKFFCSLPCLMDLKIEAHILRDDFFTELSSSPASSQIQTVHLRGGADESPHVSAPASKQLAKFLCFLPCLEDLTVSGYHLHDDFFTELTSSPPSSQIKKMYMANDSDSLQMSTLASKQLVKFLRSLPCLNDLTIAGYHLHDNFFTELSSSPASSQIQRMHMYKSLQLSAPASKQLAKFLCSLPCLKDLKIIGGYFIREDFFTELSSSPASSQIQTFDIKVGDFEQVSGLASKQLAKFLCSLPCLEDVTLLGCLLHDDFFTDLSSLAASSQSPFFRSGEYRKMLEKLSAWKSVLHPRHGHQSRPVEHVGSNLPDPPQRDLHTGLAETSEDTSVGQEHGDAIQVQNDDTLVTFPEDTNSLTSVYGGVHSVGMKPMYEYDDDPDRPSTSGLSSAYSRAVATPSYDDSTPVGRKRMHSNTDSDDNDDDDDDAATDCRPTSAGAAAAGTVSIAQSPEHRPRKRLAKTDRNPSSP